MATTPVAPSIVLAGASGDLGGEIASRLVAHGARVRALVRSTTSPDRRHHLDRVGTDVVEVDWDDPDDLTAACAGAACVVSAVNGLRPAVVEGQSRLVDAAVRAGVPRFIPSDFAVDFVDLPVGSNRNFDLRREFATHLDPAPIASTSILNGAFADMLTGEAPIVLIRLRRVLYWEDPDQVLDFTARADVADYTARAALDPSTPRTLRIAGDQVSARDLATRMGELTGSSFRLVRGGSLARLEALTRIVRRLRPEPGEVFSIWQGMQYLRSMFSGRATLDPLDNDRYGPRDWTTTRDVLAAHLDGA